MSLCMCSRLHPHAHRTQYQTINHRHGHGRGQNEDMLTPTHTASWTYVTFGLIPSPLQTPRHERRHMPPRLRYPPVFLTDRQRRCCNAMVVWPAAVAARHKFSTHCATVESDTKSVPTCTNTSRHVCKKNSTRTLRQHFTIGLEVWRVVTELTDTTNHNV